MIDHPSDSELEANVSPPDWQNPSPQPRYNLVVIGAGTAGLVAAAGAAGLGAKVALVERSRMGGDCLNVGCVPSKGMLSAARIAATVRRSQEFGVRVDSAVQIDFPAAMDRMRKLRAQISSNDSARRFQSLGVDVFFGDASFVDSETVAVNDKRLRFRRALIASGARAAAPAIPGLNRVEYLTNESVFSLTQLPRRLGVIGAGPIGCELAQAFAQFGAEVFLLESEHGILPRDDRDAARVIEEALVRDGVKLRCCAREVRVNRVDGDVQLSVVSHGASYEQRVDQLLVAAGRAPNVEGLNLEAVDVQYDRKGVNVNDYLQTTNPRIYAAGDVCSAFQFTHAADFFARTAIRNALFPGKTNVRTLIIPWCTYTLPELAHVGLSEKQAGEEHIAIDTLVQEFHEIDRAILEGESAGFVKVHLKKGTDRILGATIAARNAGDLISEITLAMTSGIGMKKIANTIHPYPTHAEAIRKLGDQYNRRRLTPMVSSLLGSWLKWQRE
jgi:pyruvate/2-oxoglutarate dehydrogenase complex dihydrolipoamide dehydrogenase (E3) component